MYAISDNQLNDVAGDGDVGDSCAAGAVAGAAIGTAMGGPVGAAIGGAIGCALGMGVTSAAAPAESCGGGN